jgi:hypothetical protein
MSGELETIYKDMTVAQSAYYLENCLKGLKKTKKNFSHYR